MNAAELQPEACSKKDPFFFVGFVFAIGFVVFLPVITFGFINYDDTIYVIHNRHVHSGFSLQTLAWACFTFDNGMWHPLTWISFLTEVTLFGVDARTSHLVNLWLHSLNGSLVFVTLRQLRFARTEALMIALVFLVQPQRIEAVAWISERKGLLGAFFILLSIVAFTKYLHSNRYSIYLASLTFYCASLLCKPVGILLPFLLISLHQGVFQFRWSLLRKAMLQIPFLVMGLAALFISFKSQPGVSDVQWSLRVANSLQSALMYIMHSLIPWHLQMPYLRPRYLEAGAVFLYLLIAGGFALLLWRAILRRGILCVMVVWFACFLLPVCGLAPVGPQGAADRYSYLPSIAVLGCLSLMARAVTERLRCDLRKIAILFLLLFSFHFYVTSRLIHNWKDSETLWRYTLKRDPDNWIANVNFAACLAGRGQLAEAIVYYKKALTARADVEGTFLALAYCHENTGRKEAAIRHLQEALICNPVRVATHLHLAELLVTDLQGSLRRKHLAFRHASEAARLTNLTDVRALELAACLAASAGDFGVARSMAERAVQVVSTNQSDADTSARIRFMLERIQDGVVPGFSVIWSEPLERSLR